MADEKDPAILSVFQNQKDSADKLRLFARPANSPGLVVLGCWAVRVSQQYIKSSAVVKNWSTSAASPIHAVVVNDALAKEIIRDCLLHLGVAVEVYERNASSLYIAQQGTPGNIADFEATLFEFGDAEVQLTSCGCVCIDVRAPGQLRIGTAVLNSTLRSVLVSEFDDVPQLVNLDAHISQFNLKELLVPAQSLSGEHEAALRRACERSNVSLTTLPKKSYGLVDVQRRLHEILRIPEEKIIMVDLPLSTNAVGCVLDHAKLGSSETDRGAFALKHVLSNQFMHLDAAAIQALNLVAVGQAETSKGKLPTTIFGWLDRCSTGMGSRLMRQWLLQPLRDVDAIVERHLLVEIMLESPVMRDSLISQVLRRCSDMDRLNRKLQRKTISLKEVHSFTHFINAVSSAVKTLKLYSGQNAKLLGDLILAPLEELSSHMENLKLLIEHTIDVADREVRIKPEFDDDLNELETQRVSILKQIDKEHAAAMKKYGWNDKQLKCELHPSYGYVFRVSRKDDEQVRESKELTTINTAKDGVRFFSEKLAGLNEQQRQVNKGYSSRQMALKSKLIETAATYLPVLDDSKELIAQLDVFVAWALVAKDSKSPMVRPTMFPPCADTSLEEATQQHPLVVLHNARHPLIELRQQNFRPNSVKLTAGPGGKNAYIITGPNMGGKSTLMRSVGVAVVLAQAGCFVPAESAEIAVRDAVMCRVGATDHMSQGVSTFMVEMLESAAIISTASRDSLVIVDELGRGTSTYDGFGLAWSIASHIADDIKAALLFSTHFHEMTDLEGASPNVVNMHFGAESTAEGGLTFTYLLEPGPCERSYGIYVAEVAKLPQEVITEAKRKADELESFAGKTEKWRRVQLDEGVQLRLDNYLAALRTASDAGDKAALQELRSTILADAPIAEILSA